MVVNSIFPLFLSSHDSDPFSMTLECFFFHIFDIGFFFAVVPGQFMEDEREGDSMEFHEFSPLDSFMGQSLHDEAYSLYIFCIGEEKSL